MMNHQNKSKLIIGLFCLVSCLESLAVFIYFFNLPADPKHAILFGFSGERLIIIFISLIYFLVGAFFLIINQRLPVLRSRVEDWIYGHTALVKVIIWGGLALTALIIVILFSSPYAGMRAMYPRIVEKVDPLAILAGLTFFQFALIAMAFMLQKAFIEKRGGDAIREILLRYFAPAAIFIFPFLFFFPRTIPVDGQFHIVANDFIPTSYTYKVYLLDLLSHLHFPLWSPAEGAGYPFFSSPFAAPFYPLNIPLAVLYKLNGGHSILDHQRYAILGVSIFAVGLYYWLREFKLSPAAVITVSFLIPVSFKIAELIRYPAGLHSIAWYPWFLLAVTRIFKSKTNRQAVGPALLLIAALFCLVTAGYPYYIYYSLFLVIPYLLLFFIPTLRRAFFDQAGKTPFSRFLIFGGACLAGVVISSPFLLNMAALLNASTGRGGNDFNYATSHVFSFSDTLGSLVFPPASQAEGWYYFGLALLLLILVYLIFSRILGKNNKPAWYLNHWVKIFLAGWFLIISYITYGRDSVLFYVLWKYMPYFSHLRTWGRLNIVIVMIVALLAAIAIDFFLTSAKASISAGEKHAKQFFKNMLIILISLYVPMIGLQFILFKYQLFDEYWTHYFAVFRGQEINFLFSGMVAFIFLLVCGYFFSRLHSIRKSHIALFSAVLIAISVVDLWPVGAFMWWADTMKVGDDIRKNYNFAENALALSFSSNRTDELRANAMILKSKFSVAYSEDWYFARYHDFFLAHEQEKSHRDILLGITDPTRIFFSQSIHYDTIKDFLADSAAQSFEYEIQYFDGDRLELNVKTSSDGYVSYIDNWDPAWKTSVNGQEKPIERLFGVFKSVKVSAGESKLVFSYQPSWIPTFVE
jgi:hypothetical protein